MPFYHRICALILLLAPMANAAASSDARIDEASCKRVDTGPGPHSLLALPGNERVLISSHERRQFEAAGEIIDYQPLSQRQRVLPRRNEPAGLVLRPHHLQFRVTPDATLIYLINHDDDTPNGRRHSILVYALESDSLRFRQRLTSPLLSSPNHLAISPDGDIYVSNDRRDGDSVMELVLRSKKATLVHYREGNGWRVAAEGLSFPNGVMAESGRVLVSQTFGGNLIEWPRLADGRLGNAIVRWKMPLLDGLFTLPGSDDVLTIAHGSLVDFLRHKSKGEHLSPATVYRVDAQGVAVPFFVENGQRISGLSAVVFSGGHVLFGQSFEPFLLQCRWVG
ncbi:MAG: hypothetical protein Q8J78_07230 [Moraxellaceae bacterium]|nr:hypothetical protein [Moraxellaceae bacterium]